jgi:hypothetical protein
MLPPVVHRRLHLYLFSRLYRHTSASASRWVPLVQLVVAFPGALASPSHCASAQCLGFCHSPHLHLVAPSHSSVGCRFTWSLTPPPLVATPPGNASCRTPLVRLVCRIAIARRLSYGWLSCFLSSHHCFLCIYASQSGKRLALSAVHVHCQRVASPTVALVVRALMHVLCQRGASPAIIVVTGARCQGMARGGSESKWMMSSVPGPPPLELGQRASCVIQL